MDIAYIEDLVYYGKYDEALSLIERGENSAELEFLKGICLREMNDLEGAIQAFKNSELMGMENRRRLHHEMALTYLKMGKVEEALDSLKSIEDPEVMLEEADILEAVGRFEEAEEKIDSSLRMKNSFGGVLAKVRFMVKRGEIQNAISMLETFRDERARVIAKFLEIINGKMEDLDGSTNYLPFMVAQTLSHAIKGEMTKAEKEAERLVSMDPYSPILHTVYGAILFLEGKEAQEELSKGQGWRDPSYIKDGLNKRGIRFLLDEMMGELSGVESKGRG